MSNFRPRVLVIDDDPYELELMTLYLNPIADVRTALGGQYAIELAQRFPMDIILLDVNMPVMNGFKTLERLRYLKECVNVPVIFVTGQHDRQTVMNSIISGTDGYLVKPVRKKDLQSRVLELYQKSVDAKRRKTILAIDNDVKNLKLMNSYLRDKYNVVIINSTNLVHSYLAKYCPDLIILNCDMLMTNGSNFLDTLKSPTDNTPIPVIVLTEASNTVILSTCYANDYSTFLTKPVSCEDLLENTERMFHQ